MRALAPDRASAGAIYAVGEKKTRSEEYDTMAGKYARVLREEILPEVEKKWPLRQDAYSRAAVAAFHVAWRETHRFSRVASVMPEMLEWLWRGYDLAKSAETYTQDPAEKDKPYFRVKIANR